MTTKSKRKTPMVQPRYDEDYFIWLSQFENSAFEDDENNYCALSNIERIYQITKDDRKDITQKALKLCEETGEVAQAILSYTNASGCGYKSKTIDDITEEIADVYIVALSLACQLDIPFEKIEEMVEKKLDVWQEKISKNV